MKDRCQSCRQALATVTETPDEFYEPVKLCANCHRRLTTHSLRPSEWYNLSGIHGNLSDLLGDEYYDETDGSALAPDEPVDDAGRLPAPRLNDVAVIPGALLTHMLIHSHMHPGPAGARRAVRADHLKAMGRHDSEVVLDTLTKRIERTANPDFFETIMVVCAELLGEAGAELVRRQWQVRGQESMPAGFPGALRGLAFASASCLPPEEASALVIDALSNMSERDRLLHKFILVWGDPPAGLTWIEKNATSPIDISWGNLAMVLGLDWPRALKWLEVGRPLSLIALDAVGLRLQKAGNLERLRLPRRDKFVAALRDYAAVDPAPRVKRSVNHLEVYASDGMADWWPT